MPAYEAFELAEKWEVIRRWKKMEHCRRGIGWNV